MRGGRERQDVLKDYFPLVNIFTQEDAEPTSRVEHAEQLDASRSAL